MYPVRPCFHIDVTCTKVDGEFDMPATNDETVELAHLFRQLTTEPSEERSPTSPFIDTHHPPSSASPMLVALPDRPYLHYLLTSMSPILHYLLPPPIHPAINAHLNPADVGQTLDDGSFGMLRLSTWLETALMTSCAPARDKELKGIQKEVEGAVRRGVGSLTHLLQMGDDGGTCENGAAWAWTLWVVKRWWRFLTAMCKVSLAFSYPISAGRTAWLKIGGSWTE